MVEQEKLLLSSGYSMFKDIERKLNNRLVDFVIGGSYLGDYRSNVFEKIKKIGQEAYAHILIQWERWKERYKD